MLLSFLKILYTQIASLIAERMIMSLHQVIYFDFTIAENSAFTIMFCHYLNQWMMIIILSHTELSAWSTN